MRPNLWAVSDAALQVAQAKLALAQATLQRLKVMAPFDGTAGLRQINVGDYLKDGTDMVNVEDIEAVLLDFRLPERFQNKIKPGQKAQVTMDAVPGRKFTAVIQAIDPLIDANGRSQPSFALCLAPTKMNSFLNE